ncbi:hypothetical protein [Streptomyces beigongshangae]|uniref:hypothetical protein n=1 Tax=Streptomyces beigongshangae TaxID=2841597 RepID=UPI001C862D58|nr:hypothetical protein [Streptomyces sp. REN17]
MDRRAATVRRRSSLSWCASGTASSVCAVRCRSCVLPGDCRSAVRGKDASGFDPDSAAPLHHHQRGAR